MAEITPSQLGQQIASEGAIGEHAEPTELAPREAEYAILEAARRKARAEARMEELKADDYLEEIRARRKYANLLFWLTVGWLATVISIVLMQGFLGAPFYMGNYSFQLSDEVLLALIGGTSASVIGLFVFVARHFFPEKK